MASHCDPIDFWLHFPWDATVVDGLAPSRNWQPPKVNKRNEDTDLGGWFFTGFEQFERFF